MLWIKRNLALAITGAIALVCLAAGIFFVYSSVGRNKDLAAQLEEQKTKLDNLYRMKPFPSRTNIAALQKESGKLKEVIGQAKDYFKPVPAEKLTGMAFKAKLDETIAAMKKKAQEGSVKLPDDYRFSFKSEQQALTLDPASFPALPMQVAEVEAIASILFEAKINALENIRRPRITAKEVGQTDYHTVAVETNAATRFTSTPYEFTFFSFSSELAQILKSLYEARSGFVVKDIVIEAVEPPKPPPKRNPLQVNPSLGTAQPPPAGNPGSPQRRITQRPVAALPPGQLETVISERLLKITLWIYVLKPLA